MALFDRLFNSKRILELQEKNDRLSQLLKESQEQVYALKAQIQEAEFFPVYKARKDYYAIVAEYSKLIESIKQFLTLNVPDDGSSDHDRIRKVLIGVVESMHSINKKVFTAMTSN